MLNFCFNHGKTTCSFGLNDWLTPKTNKNDLLMSVTELFITQPRIHSWMYPPKLIWWKTRGGFVHLNNWRHTKTVWILWKKLPVLEAFISGGTAPSCQHYVSSCWCLLEKVVPWWPAVNSAGTQSSWWQRKCVSLARHLEHFSFHLDGIHLSDLGTI